MRAVAVALMLGVMATPVAAFDRVELAFQADPALETQALEVPAAPVVRKIVAKQIEAVRQDDAKAAFAAITPKLKQQFVNGQSYLRVIRAQFPALGDARLVSFGELRETSFGFAQMVRLSNARGEPWLAFFLMDRDKAGAWRIGNVVMVKQPSTEA